MTGDFRNNSCLNINSQQSGANGKGAIQIVQEGGAGDEITGISISNEDSDSDMQDV